MKNFLYLVAFLFVFSSCNDNAENNVLPNQNAKSLDYSKIAQGFLQNAENQNAYLNQQVAQLNLSKEELEKASRNASNSFINLKDPFKRLNNIGNQLFGEENYYLSLFYYINSLQITTLNGELEGQAIAYRNMALTYQKLGDYENAAINFWQSFYLWEQIGNESRKGQLYNDLGVIYALAHDFVPAANFNAENSEALHFYEAALDIHHASNDTDRVAQAEGNIDVLYTAWLGKELSKVAKDEKDELQYAQDDVEDIL